jgi:predicted DCC family thiol-disulfide oxidoreductase YuxK
MTNSPKGWVLYDGMCGFCSWWIPFWQKTIQRTGYDIAPLQTDWVRKTLAVDEVLLNKDIVLLFADGSRLVGADAYIFGMKTVWWSSPAGYVLGIPPFKQLTWLFYKLFNRNRFFVSKVCRLKPLALEN